jgi:serine/threonine-protein kinase
MADIFLAKKVGVGGFEKTFVIKRMLDSLSGSPEFVGMFFDEARLAAKLSHPNITQIYDFGIIDGLYYIAMEHIPGEDLRSILTRCWEKRVKVPVGVALRIMIDVCAGLDYAHTLEEDGKPLHIIHRDVSPSNVMVSFQGAVKLLDFGIAKATSRMCETRTGNVKGKYSFLSPEQIQGHPVDARADLFALGISFFELLTKRRPFRRDNELATVHAILHDEIPDPRSFRDSLPEEISTIVRRALARKPEDRYASAGQMRADLQALLNRTAPGLGQVELVQFMQALFSREEIDGKTRVPQLAEVKTTDLSVPPPSPLRAMTSPGLTPTGASPLSGERTPTGPAAPPPRDRRWVRRGLLGGALLAAGLGAGTLLSTLRAPAAPAAAGAGLAAATQAGPAPAAAPAADEDRGAARAADEPARPSAAAPLAPTPARRADEPPPRARAARQLDEAMLQAIVRRAQGGLTACFEKHRGELPAGSGQVTVELEVTPAGRVATARAQAPGLPSAALAGCLEGAARRIRFPRHADETLRFSFPLAYRKAE